MIDKKKSFILLFVAYTAYGADAGGAGPVIIEPQRIVQVEPVIIEPEIVVENNNVAEQPVVEEVVVVKDAHKVTLENTIAQDLQNVKELTESIESYANRLLRAEQFQLLQEYILKTEETIVKLIEKLSENSTKIDNKIKKIKKELNSNENEQLISKLKDLKKMNNEYKQKLQTVFDDMYLQASNYFFPRESLQEFLKNFEVITKLYDDYVQNLTVLENNLETLQTYREEKCDLVTVESNIKVIQNICDQLEAKHIVRLDPASFMGFYDKSKHVIHPDIQKKLKAYKEKFDKRPIFFETYKEKLKDLIAKVKYALTDKQLERQIRQLERNEDKNVRKRADRKNKEKS